MDFIQQVQSWAKGDIVQGKWMIGITFIVLLPICVLLIKNSNALQKGMLLPICLLCLMNMGYGGYLLSSRPVYIKKAEERFRLDTQKTIKNEVVKIKADDKSYTITKYIWASLLIFSVITFFIFDKEYFQGLSLGFALMFLGMLLIDVFLHQRLKVYLTALYEMLAVI